VRKLIAVLMLGTLLLPGYGFALGLGDIEVNSALNAKKSALADAVLNARLETEWLDVTLPSRAINTGSVHPISQVTEEVIAIFADMGFSVAEGPRIETDWYNFDALNIPGHHPARAEMDTFYMKRNSDDKRPPHVLRTHTSPVQVRTMEKSGAPIRVICPGGVYRADYDQTHTPMFHQVEGLAVDKDLSMANLKWVLEQFVKAFFSVDDVELRFRASHFPFTEPSAEVDISCKFCKGSGCRVCSHTGWLEVLGCGIVDENVFKAVGYSNVSGYAFGLGIERFAMLIHEIGDLRSLFESDIRLLGQFR
jgi:phenylalanyl-tRNA synthetase alpha chain